MIPVTLAIVALLWLLTTVAIYGYAARQREILRNAIEAAEQNTRGRLIDSVQEIGTLVLSDLDLKQVLSSVVTGFCRVLNVEAASIFLLSEDTSQFELAVTTEQSLVKLYGKPYPLSHFTYTGDPDLEQVIDFLYREVLNMDAQSRILIPLVVRNRQVGFLVANQPVTDEASADEALVAKVFAAQAAVAIRNAQLYEAQQAEAWVTNGLLQVAETVNAQVDDENAIQLIASLTSTLANSHTCIILRLNADRTAYDILAAHGVVDGVVADQIKIEDDPFLRVASVTDQPIKAGEETPFDIPSTLRGLVPIKQLIGFPLWSLSEAIGLLLVEKPDLYSSGKSRWEQLLRGIAHQTATLLETSILKESDATRKRLEQELSVAHAIQTGFIPAGFEPLPGWDVAADWKAAQQVGGDFYDYFKLKDGRWGLVMADVTDKGIPAALFMAMCRSLIRAVAMNRTSARDTLERFNDLLLNDSRSDMFLTVFYAIWQPQTGQLHYSSAGHPPQFIYRAALGQIEELVCPGLATGIIHDITLTERKATLQPGDSLIMYTDGISEAMQRDHTEWGRSAFHRAVCRAPHNSAKSVLDYVLHQIEDFTQGAPQSDDMTLLVIQRQAEALFSK